MSDEKPSIAKKSLIDWELVRKWIFLFPVAHLALCYVFLFFYQIDFGGGISEFFSPNDVFNLSYREVGKAYAVFAVALGIPLFFDEKLENQNPLFKSRADMLLRGASWISFVLVVGFSIAVFWILFPYKVTIFPLIAILTSALILLRPWRKHLEESGSASRGIANFVLFWF